MENFIELMKNIAAVVGCISACIGLIVVIFKPIRQSIINTFAKKSEYRKLVDAVQEIKEKQNEAIKKQDMAIRRLDTIEQTVYENEIDRLKSELFNCGNRCRRGIKLHPEEMGHIREVYHKYNEVLHQNHDGTLEYEFILNYYNSQAFISNNKTN